MAAVFFIFFNKIWYSNDSLSRIAFFFPGTVIEPYAYTYRFGNISKLLRMNILNCCSTIANKLPSKPRYLCPLSPDWTHSATYLPRGSVSRALIRMYCAWYLTCFGFGSFLSISISTIGNLRDFHICSIDNYCCKYIECDAIITRSILS